MNDVIGHHLTCRYRGKIMPSITLQDSIVQDSMEMVFWLWNYKINITIDVGYAIDGWE